MHEFRGNADYGVPVGNGRGKRTQHERDKVRRPCIRVLRERIAKGLLKRYPCVYWSCPPDFSKVTGRQAGTMVLNGYEKGVFDLTIVAAGGDVVRVWLIEFKWKTGYTKEQRVIADKFLHTPVVCLKIKSVDEFILFLETNL